MIRIFHENDRVAQQTAQSMRDRGVLAVNLLGAPGAGKTTVITQLASRMPKGSVCCLQADLESDIDTQKLTKLGVVTKQINTHGTCHLDALVIADTLTDFLPQNAKILFIENIGNLVCTADFKIGEHVRILVSSVAEGSDKPYKYPPIFQSADTVILTKTDLLEHVDFNQDEFIKGVNALCPTAPIFFVNGRSGQGFEEVISWLISRNAQA